MLNYILVKPEAIHLLPLLEKTVRERTLSIDTSDQVKHTLAILQDGFRSLLYGEKPVSPEIVRIQFGQKLSDKTFRYVYPQPPVEYGDSLRKALVDKPYGIIFIESVETTSEMWKIVKGKFRSEGSPRGSGLRGTFRSTREQYEAPLWIEGEMPAELPVEQNFVHMPDTPDEAQKLFEYLSHAPVSESVTLYERR